MSLPATATAPFAPLHLYSAPIYVAAVEAAAVAVASTTAAVAATSCGKCDGILCPSPMT